MEAFAEKVNVTVARSCWRGEWRRKVQDDSSRVWRPDHVIQVKDTVPREVETIGHPYTATPVFLGLCLPQPYQWTSLNRIFPEQGRPVTEGVNASLLQLSPLEPAGIEGANWKQFDSLMCGAGFLEQLRGGVGVGWGAIQVGLGRLWADPPQAFPPSTAPAAACWAGK